MNEAVVATLDGEPLRAQFPMRTTVFGVAVVVIPEAEYASLKDEASRDQLNATRARKSRSPIDNDPEVAEFLASSRSKLYDTEAIGECVRRFGIRRTPSTSALNRFWQRLERPQAK